jgi:hypothetical protein
MTIAARYLGCGSPMIVLAFRINQIVIPPRINPMIR